MAANHQFQVEASSRDDIGKGASRRLRRAKKVPGIVYGGGKNTLPLLFEHNKLAMLLENEAFYSHILTLNINGESERVILKDLQRHPFRAEILHVDFQRVRADQKLHMNIPLHFIGGENAPGAKDAGGVISHIMTDVEISCLPDDLPEYIEVDISTLELNQILHLSDIKLPKGVELVDLLHENDKPIVSLHIPREEPEPELITEETPVSASEVPAIEQKAEGEEGEEEGGKK